MSQFKGYRVHLRLKNGRELDGEITSVVDKVVELKTSDAVLSFKGSEIDDLEVLDLAPSKKDRRNKKQKAKNSNSENVSSPSQKKVELEEFDFAANLKKFDKQSVFAELERQELEQNGGVLPKIDNGKIGINESIVNNEADLKTSNKKNNETTNSSTTSELRSTSQQQQSAKLGQFVIKGTKVYVPTFSTLKLSQILDYNKTNVLVPPLYYETAATNLSALISARITNPKIESPLVVNFMGNNSNGIISLSSSRHLLNKEFSVIIFYQSVLDDTNDESSKEQINIELSRIKMLGGIVVTDLKSLESELSKFSGGAALFVDALQDEYTDLTDASEENQNALASIIDFINTSSTTSLSLGAPCGINMSSGGNDLEQGAVRPSHIVSIGVVLSALTNMYKFADPKSPRSQHWIIDADLPRTLKIKNSIRKYDNIAFRTSNSYELEFID